MHEWQLDASQASLRMQAGALTSEAYVRACLERTAEREPIVQAWAHQNADHAIAQARVLDAMPRRSPLHGIPVAFKDVIRTRDFPTTFNSPVYPDHRPNEDAHVVAVLRSLGMVVMGKVQTLEFACGGTFPTTRNPWSPERTPGGSSSGSAAAVADGMVPLSLGTQTGGSTIRPAAFCGAYGMKPTWGRIPFDGIKSFAAHLDTVGLFGRSVGDLRLLLQAFHLLDGGNVQPVEVKGLRCGVCRTPKWHEAQPEMQAAFESTLARLSAAGVSLQDIEFDATYSSLNDWQDEVMQDGGRSAFLPELLADPVHLHADFKAKLNNHLGLTPQRMRDALDALARARYFFESAMGDLDAVLTPSAPGPAPVGLHTQGMAVFNRLWTALQVPCVTIPAMWTAQGLPMGLQLVHRRYEDQRLLDVALALASYLDEGRHPWNA